MEYGINLNKEYDENYTKFVGYTENNNCIRQYFSKQTIDILSYKITELLEGVDIHNRKIVVPDKTIANVMSSVYDSFRPQTGNLYSRYNIPNGTGPDNYVQDMIDQVIEIIVSDVKNNLGMEQYNSTLSAWTTVLGDFNSHGLQQHSKIKIRNKRPAPMQFNMNY